jgi:glutathione-regulated potassium-efflux system ancillary protein KefG
MMQAISTGGPQNFYGATGKNRFEIDELLAPFDQTAYLCGMAWLEPFAIYVGRRIPRQELSQQVEKYRDLVIGLRDGNVKPMKQLARNYTLPTNFNVKKA